MILALTLPVAGPATPALARVNLAGQFDACPSVDGASFVPAGQARYLVSVDGPSGPITNATVQLFSGPVAISGANLGAAPVSFTQVDDPTVVSRWDVNGNGSCLDDPQLAFDGLKGNYFSPNVNAWGGVGGPINEVQRLTSAGSAPANEVQSINATGATAGTFTLSFGGNTTSTRAYNDTAAVICFALNALPSIIAGGGVTCGGGALDVAPVTVTFSGAGFAGVDQPQMTFAIVTAFATTNLTIGTLTPGGSGSFTLSFAQQTTAALPFNATNAQIQAALDALTQIGAGNAVVSGGPLASGAFVSITFSGAGIPAASGTVAGRNVPQITVNVVAPFAGGAVAPVGSTFTGGVQATALSGWANAVVSAAGFQSVSIPAAATGLGTDGTGACGLWTGCIVSLGTVVLTAVNVTNPTARGAVAGTVTTLTGTPLAGVNVVLTASDGVVQATLTNAAGFYQFANVTVGAYTVVAVDNANAPVPCGTALAGVNCGFLGASGSGSVTAGAVSTSNMVLNNKTTPSASVAVPPVAGVATTTPSAFGFVYNKAGLGIGGATITSSCGGGPAISAAQSGLWFITGITPGAACTFSVSMPGLTSAAITAAGGIGTSPAKPIVAGAGWLDPSFIIVTPAVVAAPLPVINSGIIQGQVVDSQGVPMSSPSGSCNTIPNVCVIAYNLATRQFTTTTTGVSGAGLTCATTAGCYQFLLTPGTATPPGSYIITVIDNRSTIGCVAAQAFIAAPNSTPPIPCGMMPQSKPFTVLPNQVNDPNNNLTTGNFVMVAKIDPATPALGALSGIFGYVVDLGNLGGISGSYRGLQGVRVYIVPSPAASNPVGPLTPTVVTDAFGRYQYPNVGQTGLAAGTYDVVVQLPQGTITGVPNCTNLSGAAAIGVAVNFGLSTQTCIAAGNVTVAGGWTDPTFAFSPQNLISPFPGEGVNRRLEQVIPLVSRNPDTSRLGGWDVETTEIRIANAGPTLTTVEIAFFSTDVSGVVGSTGTTRTAVVVPGAAYRLLPTDLPDGCTACWAAVSSVVPPGQEGIMQLSSLVGTMQNITANAGGALTITNTVPREEIVSPNAASSIPLAYRNYGGTGAKWSTQIAAVNMGQSASVTFNFYQKDATRSDQRSCARACIITRFANPGATVLLNLGDNNDPDVAQLPDGGTFVVVVTASGSINTLTGQFGINAGYGPTMDPLIGAIPVPLPGGYVLYALHVSQVGKAATASYGSPAQASAYNAELQGRMYASLVFKNYEGGRACDATAGPCGWNTGLSVADVGSQSASNADYNVTFYDDGGRFVGTSSDKLSVSSNPDIKIMYTPAIGFIPDGYRGTAIVTEFRSASGIPFIDLRAAPTFAGYAVHTNYNRNQAIGYNMVGVTSATNRAEAQGELPCNSSGPAGIPGAFGITLSQITSPPYVSCMWAPKYQKNTNASVAGNPGVNTGIRIFNIDPGTALLGNAAFGSPGTGAPATVRVDFIDDAGVVWTDASDTFQIPAFGTATTFSLYNGRLPNLFNGSARITSVGNNITAVVNVVDYTAMDHDGSGAYNPQYSNGRTM